MSTEKGRPFTSTSTTGFFGARIQTRNKNLSMNPKVSMYQTDGFGRDSYIKIPNGGFRKVWNNNFHQSYFNKKSLTDYIKSTRISPKFAIYRCDGSGRDTYIQKSCGGFYHLYNFPVNYKSFFGSLREYSYDPFVNEKLEKNKYNFQKYVKLFSTPKEAIQANKLRKLQRTSSAKLAVPKYIREKYDNRFPKIKIKQ